ncbi:MAG TPA: tetratricopeptide repeat protein, partial [Salinivirgaceae bacterium]|nr:tetratricopeptide repeat protein [Salinivirgaceae bacterium]
YYQETNRPKQAIEQYQQILNQIDSTALDPLFNIGYIYQEQEKYSESIQYFSKATKYHPYEARVFYRLALSYEKLNQRDSAIVNYRRTLDVDPDFEEAFNAIDRLTRK